jgi:hypothetical protein
MQTPWPSMTIHQAHLAEAFADAICEGPAQLTSLGTLDSFRFCRECAWSYLDMYCIRKLYKHCCIPIWCVNDYHILYTYLHIILGVEVYTCTWHSLCNCLVLIPTTSGVAHAVVGSILPDQLCQITLSMSMDCSWLRKHQLSIQIIK